MTKSIPGSG